MVTVEDDTVLSTLTGEEGNFKNLVEQLFGKLGLDLTWTMVKTFTLQEFLDKFAANPTTRSALDAWAKYYNLGGRFKPPKRKGETSAAVDDDAKRQRPSPTKPTGEKVALTEAKALHAWLLQHMQDNNKLLSNAHVLGDALELKFSLQHREEAMEKGTRLLEQMYSASTSGVKSRISYPIPVCSGMSGIGKTRFSTKRYEMIGPLYSMLLT